MKVYVASSWRNSHQPKVVEALLRCGHEVYDFRAPSAEAPGFAWEQLDLDWESWGVSQFRLSLSRLRAQEAFEYDRAGLEWCDTCLLVLPSGKSSHLEAGWCAARGKLVVIYSPEKLQPELMYKLFDREGQTPIFSSLDEILNRLDEGGL